MTVQGTSQTRATFWSGVAAEYNSTPDVISRTSIMLQSRFNHISQKVMRYVSKLSHQYNQQASGTNSLDWVERARQAYQAETGKSFMFDNCYQILKELPKYDIQNTSMNNEFDNDSPVGPNLSDETGTDRERPYRPPGRQGEKQRARQRARGESVSTNSVILNRCEDFNVMFKNKEDARVARALKFDSQMDQFLTMKRQDQRTKKQDQLLRVRDKQDALMSIDMNNLSQEQKQYHYMRFQELQRMVDEIERALQDMDSPPEDGPSSAPM